VRFIGQHIWKFISRFYSSVYFNSVEEHVSDPDKFLAIDADNKLVYRTGENVLDDIGAGTGSITGVTITTDSGGGSTASDTSGSADFSLLGASGVGVTNSGTEITVTSVPGEINHNSLLNYSAAAHYRWDTDISSTATINASNIPTLNQDTTGTANRAINLVASTSTAVALGSIELGHATDTTIARTASGVATIEDKTIQTKDKVIHVEAVNFADNLGTNEHFIPFVTTTESENFSNVVTPMNMPTAGKLLKIHFRSSQHTNVSSNTITFKLYKISDGTRWSGTNETLVGTKVVDGVARTTHAVADFQDLTTSGASGNNFFAANDLIGVSITHSQAQGTTEKISVTMVFELDFNSY